MRTYETLYIIRPDLQEEEVAAIAQDVESQITNDGGTIVRSEIWGKRRLAYEVQKCSEGYYILVRFTATPTFVARLENFFRLTDTVIRYLLLQLDDRTLRLETSQKERKEAELRNAATARPRDEDDDEDDAVARPRGRRYRDDDGDDEDAEDE